MSRIILVCDDGTGEYSPRYPEVPSGLDVRHPWRPGRDLARTGPAPHGPGAGGGAPHAGRRTLPAPRNPVMMLHGTFSGAPIAARFGVVASPSPPTHLQSFLSAAGRRATLRQGFQRSSRGAEPLQRCRSAPCGDDDDDV